jgi:uncharacterized protein
MENELNNKLDKLKNYIKNKKRAVIAFSGGVDSTFLLNTAKEVLLKENLLAIMIKFSVVDIKEFDDAINFAKKSNINLKVIDINELEIYKFSENPPDRCYHCKKFIFKRILDEAKKMNYKNIFDGSNIDDVNDYRPGEKVIKELNILSPLKECDFTKNDIRKVSKYMNLKTWNMPSAACLASRFPYGDEINKKKLIMVRDSEIYIKSLGFKQVRVRHHNEIARIEISEEEFTKVFDLKTIKLIEENLKSLGFKYVTIDLKGYRTGSMNEILKM